MSSLTKSKGSPAANTPSDPARGQAPAQTQWAVLSLGVCAGQRRVTIHIPGNPTGCQDGMPGPQRSPSTALLQTACKLNIIPASTEKPRSRPKAPPQMVNGAVGTQTPILTLLRPDLHSTSRLFSEPILASQPEAMPPRRPSHPVSP